MTKPLNKCKRISLVFASLFIFTLAISSQSFNLDKASQQKNQGELITTFTDDLDDDDLNTEQISSIHQLHFIQLPTPLTCLQDRTFISVAPSSSSQIPFYLKIQNLRI
jgi:hypothetical protein